MRQFRRYAEGALIAPVLRWLRQPLIEVAPWHRRLQHYGMFLLLIGLSSPISHAYLNVELSPGETIVHTILVVVAVTMAILLVEGFAVAVSQPRVSDRHISTGGFLVRATMAYLLSIPAVGFVHAPIQFTRSILNKHAAATDGRTAWELLPIVLLVVYVAYQVMRKDHLAKELEVIRRINGELLNAQPRQRQVAEQRSRASAVIRVQSKGIEIPLSAESVVRVESDQNYCHVVADAPAGTMSQRYLVRMTLNEARTRLPEQLFLQTHRSHLVNLRYVAALGRDGRRLKLRLSNGEQVPVSRSRVGPVKTRIGDFLSEA